MEEEIKKFIEEYKKVNGEKITFTTKELILGLYKKTDEMMKHDGEQDTRIAKNTATIAVIVVLLTGLCLKLFVFS